MQFTTAILALAATAFAAPNVATRGGQCTFGQYVCSHDGLSIKQCDISGNWVVSIFSPCLSLSLNIHPILPSSSPPPQRTLTLSTPFPELSIPADNYPPGDRRLPQGRLLRLRQHQQAAVLLRAQEGEARRRRLRAQVRHPGHLLVHGRPLGHQRLQRREPARAQRALPGRLALRAARVGQLDSFLRGELERDLI